MIDKVNSSNIKTSIFYINDYHGKSINMERTVNAARDFDIYSKNTDSLKLSSGDIMLGEDITTNKAAILFQNTIGISASAIGNHEFDILDKAEKIIPYAKYQFLSNNIKINPRSAWSKVTKSSVVKEINGHKYGIIGTTPVDLFTRSKMGAIKKDLQVDGAQETLNDIQTEIDKLKAQGINKIILLSHLGNQLEKFIAQNTSGLDVILGGHSHELILDIKEGENLFYNKDAEPVIITQAGKDGKNFGILNLEFDSNGTIKKVQNNVGETKNFQRNPIIKYIFDKMFDNNQTYGYINSAPKEPEKYLISPNPHGYFIADCMKNDTNSEIALIQSANLRGFFEKGKLDKRLINDIIPFKNELYLVKYSEKDIVDAIRFAAANSFQSSANKPGIFYTSGLKYSVSNKGELLSMNFIDNSGNEFPININNPRKDKFYTTVINDYCAQGNDKLTMLNHPDQIIKKLGFDATECIERQLQKIAQPIDIKDDGRITVIA